MAGATGLRYNFGRSHNNNEIIADSPLFERQRMNNQDDYIDLRLLIDNLQQKISRLEKINVDLESRLEDQAKQSMAVEKECLSIEQGWKAKNDELMKEIEGCKDSLRMERVKGDRLREHLGRTERELYGMLQRKYEFNFMRGPNSAHGGTSSNNKNQQQQQQQQSLKSSIVRDTSDDMNGLKTRGTNNNDIFPVSAGSYLGPYFDSALSAASGEVQQHVPPPFQSNKTLPLMKTQESKKARERHALADLSAFLGFSDA